MCAGLRSVLAAEDGVRIAVVILPLLLSAGAQAQTAGSWQLVWSDEFNAAAGTPPDPANWNFDLGGGGWGNQELEVYTDSIDNAFQDGLGNLVIRVIRDAQGNYTSARLQSGDPGVPLGPGESSSGTADRSWQYGLIEARIKLPFGTGIWPAFWMLGEDYATVGWPRCGEIDIMENFGTFSNNATVNNGTIHGPGNGSAAPPDYPPSGIGKSTQLLFGDTVYNDYHVYAVEWSENSIEFFVDGVPYQTLTPSSLPAGALWPFNAPMFPLLNVAVGSSATFLGTPDASVAFPQDMLVDYVRIYRAATVTPATPAITPGSVINAASYLGSISPGSLATLYGANLADAEHLIAGPAAGQSFPTAVAGVTVNVNGVNAPLIYVSPTQINFQVPWETAPGLDVPFEVVWNGVASSIEPVTIASASSPSFFLSELMNGVAWVTGDPADGCPSPASDCSVRAGGSYQLWANGLGPKSSQLQDGTPAPGAPLAVAGGTVSCLLTIGGLPATVTYCGAAPDEIIDQVNFIYPSGVSAGSPYVGATLSVNGVAGYFRVPAPSAPAN